MLQTFDKKVPLSEQRERVANAKVKGWKHGAKRRNWKIKEKQRNRVAFKNMLRDKFRAKAAAYWKGERETYPE